MIIGIDVSSTQYGTGVSNYTSNLVEHLLKIDPDNIYKLFFSSLRQPIPESIDKLSRFPNVRIYHYHLPTSLLEFIWNHLRWLPVEWLIGDCHVFHTSDWTQPPTVRAKTVTTVHDLVPILFPQWSHPKIVATHQTKLKLVTKNCHHIICVSQNTKNDLQKRYPQLKDSQISVIYEAAEDKYHHFLKINPNKRQLQIQNIYKKYHLKYYFLAQATHEPRKNLNRIIKAFIKFRQINPNSPTELAICGKYGWGQNVQTPVDSSIKILGYVPEKEIVALHAAATCLIYPSLYEGFGLPIVKSMAVGVPVITSNNSSMIEVSGQSAILVNPRSINQIYQAIQKIIKSPELRSQLAKSSLKQSKKFSWTKTAQKTLKIYQNL